MSSEFAQQYAKLASQTLHSFERLTFLANDFGFIISAGTQKGLAQDTSDYYHEAGGSKVQSSR